MSLNKFSNHFKKKYYAAAMLILAFSLLITSLQKLLGWNLFIPFLFLTLSVGLYGVSIFIEFKLLIRLLAVFIFFHFLIFPFAYIFIIKKDPYSFQFDPNIFETEKSGAISEINYEYNPDHLKRSVEVVKKIMNGNHSILDSTMEYFNRDKIAICDAFILAKDCKRIPSDHPAYGAALLIYDSLGQLVRSYVEREGCNFQNGNQLIRNYLRAKYDLDSERIKNWEVESDRIILKNDIWSYHRIISYSINMFSTGNIVPKSRWANIIFFIHQFLVIGLVLGLLTSFLHEYLIRTSRQS